MRKVRVGMAGSRTGTVQAMKRLGRSMWRIDFSAFSYSARELRGENRGRGGEDSVYFFIFLFFYNWYPRDGRKLKGNGGR